MATLSGGNGDGSKPNKPKGRPKLPVLGQDELDGTKGFARQTPEFGAKIKSMRGAKRISQNELCKQLTEANDVLFSQAIISRLEHGQQPPLPDQILMLWRFFACDLEWLLDSQAPAESQYSGGLDNSYTQAINMMRLLPAKEAVRRLMIAPAGTDQNRMELITPQAESTKKIKPTGGNRNQGSEAAG